MWSRRPAFAITTELNKFTNNLHLIMYFMIEVNQVTFISHKNYTSNKYLF